MRSLAIVGMLLLVATPGQANPPVASYLFPAGGQRGTTVPFHVGGLYLGQRCDFHLQGPGMTATPQLKTVPTRWFEGPHLPLPDSQRQEDYPRDMAGSVTIAADAPLGNRPGHVATSEGVAGGLTFVVGELPEIVEQEIDGEPIPVAVKYPLTINGRIFPRQDRDLWTLDLKPGTTLTVAVQATKFGSPLDARVEILGPDGRQIAEKEADGRDPQVRFTAMVAGLHTIRISDGQLGGSQAHVYRLTITEGPWVDTIFPLGGRAGQPLHLTATGQGLANSPFELSVPQGEGPVSMSLVAGSNLILVDRDQLPEALPGDRVLAPPVVLNGRISNPGDVQMWSIRLDRGKPVAFVVRAAVLGSRLQGVLVLKDVVGKVVARTESKVGAVDPALTFTPPTDGVYTLEVSDRFTRRGGDDFGYRVRVSPTEPNFGIRVATEALNVVRGGTAKVRVTVDRQGGFMEPIDLTVEGLPGGATVAPARFDKKTTTLDLQVTASADAVLGATSVRVVATSGAIRHTSPMLLGVAIPVPFKIVADYEMRWSSRGSTHRRSYRVERNGYEGELVVRLADRQARHLQGVTGPTVTLGANQDRFEYPVQLAPDMEIGRTCRVCIMATGLVKEGGRQYEVHYSKAEQNDQIITVVETGRLAIVPALPAILAQPGKTVEVPFVVSRARELTGASTVTLIVPEHVRGVKAEPVVLPADNLRGRIHIHFAERAGPFNLPLTLRVTNGLPGDCTRGEAQLEVIQETTR